MGCRSLDSVCSVRVDIFPGEFAFGRDLEEMPSRASHDRSLNLPSFATGPGATAATLHAVVSSYAVVSWYAVATPLRFDGNFCLRLALGIVAIRTRGIIAIRSA